MDKHVPNSSNGPYELYGHCGFTWTNGRYMIHDKSLIKTKRMRVEAGHLGQFAHRASIYSQEAMGSLSRLGLQYKFEILRLTPLRLTGGRADEPKAHICPYGSRPIWPRVCISKLFADKSKIYSTPFHSTPLPIHMYIYIYMFNVLKILNKLRHHRFSSCRWRHSTWADGAPHREAAVRIAFQRSSTPSRDLTCRPSHLPWGPAENNGAIQTAAKFLKENADPNI